MRAGSQEPGAVGLAVLGLTSPSWALYEALIDRSGATVAELAEYVPAGGRQLGRALRALEDTGLITRKPGRPVAYQAIPPQIGLERLVADKENALRQARESSQDLAERFHAAQSARSPASLVEVITGESAVSQRYTSIHRLARDQLRVMSRPPYIVSAQENRAITADAHQLGVTVRNLLPAIYFTDGDAAQLAAAREDLAAGEQMRLLPSTPLKLLIADTEAAIIPLQLRRQTIFSAVEVHASPLLDALIEIFEVLWQIATPLDILNPTTAALGRVRLTSDERLLLGMLASGATDAVVAAQLRLSASTLKRRISLLKARLGAASRFQAGWLARDQLAAILDGASQRTTEPR